jgi:uncharacterized Zn-finger protein
MLEDHNGSMDFGAADQSVDAFIVDADSIFDDAQYETLTFRCRSTSAHTLTSFTNPLPTPFSSQSILARSRSDPNPTTNAFPQSRIPTLSSSVIPTRSPFPPPASSIIFTASSSATHSSTATPSASNSSSSEKDKYKCHCGYIPRGEEKWKPSNLVRHKRTQHPVEVKVYKCPFAGCASTFTRSDNLRSHARDKGHDVAGATKEWSGTEEKREKGDVEDVELRQRPSKRRNLGLTESKNCLKGLDEEFGFRDGDDDWI